MVRFRGKCIRFPNTFMDISAVFVVIIMKNILHKCIQNKKATINSKNSDDKSFQCYAIIAALNYKNIGKHPERITKIKPFINQHKWKNIIFLQK